MAGRFIRQFMSFPRDFEPHTCFFSILSKQHNSSGLENQQRTVHEKTTLYSSLHTNLISAVLLLSTTMVLHYDKE